MATINFVWDELSDNVLFETDELDAVTAQYSNRPEQFGELLSQNRSGIESFFHFDAGMSTRQLTDESEDITDTLGFTAYGEEFESSGTTENPFGYKGAVGYYSNGDTDDIYVRARTYEPALGAWLSKDPLGFVDGVSLYRAYFVPANVDPSGSVVRHFKPEFAEVRSMPWSTPQGLKLFGWGTTVPVEYQIECFCQCSNYANCTYSLYCAVTSYLRIVIDPAKIPYKNLDAQRRQSIFGGKISKAYGHEQRHVQSLSYWAEVVAKVAKTSENSALNTSWAFCQREKKSLLLWADKKLKDAKANNAKHNTKWDQFIPVGGRAYDPLARLGKKDNSYPGNPPQPAMYPNFDVLCIGPAL